MSEAASAAGLSPKAVRLYETKGLLPPAPRTRAGYRTHTDDDVAVLRVIHQAKTLGLVLPFLIRLRQGVRRRRVRQRRGRQPAAHLRLAPAGRLRPVHPRLGRVRPAAVGRPVTHRSPEHWCRAIGWYGMASTQVLDELPADHPKRQQLIDVVRKLAVAMAGFQDPATGR